MRRRALIFGFSAAAMCPIGVGAQQESLPVVGVLTGVNIAGGAFQDGLRKAGFVEGQNVAIEHRNALGQYEELPATAADLVLRKVVVIVAFGSAEARAAKRATRSIPIVFWAKDPVLEGLVASFARPGGNLTGVSVIDPELTAKRLALLSQLVPRARLVALLANPNGAAAEAVIRSAQEAARAKDVQLVVLKAGDYIDIDAAFATIRQQHVEGLIVDDDRFLGSRRDYLIALAARAAVPAIYGWSRFAWAGGLISYGPSRDAARRQMGIYPGKILKGAKPADLPVVQPDNFELLFNLKTANAFGLRVPPSLLAQADEVVE